MSTFASRLLQARSAAGLTQKELADSVGISTVQLSRYEGGKSTPRPPVMTQLALALGVNSKWLADESEPPDAPEVLVEREKDGGATLTFRPDPETAKRWQDLAAKTGMDQDALFGLVVRELAEQFKSHPTRSMEEMYEELHKRLRLLEDRISQPAQEPSRKS